jgi:hypothetical protein
MDGPRCPAHIKDECSWEIHHLSDGHSENFEVSDADGTVLYLMEMGDIQMVEVGMSSLKSLQRP